MPATGRNGSLPGFLTELWWQHQQQLSQETRNRLSASPNAPSGLPPLMALSPGDRSIPAIDPDLGAVFSALNSFA